MLNKRPFVFNIVGGYELNKIRNFGIVENQGLVERLRGNSMKSKLYYIKIDVDNRLGNILFSDADNREDAIKDLYYVAKNILKWGDNFKLSLENRQFPYLQLGDPTITSNFNSRQYFERLNAAGVTQCPDIEIFNKVKVDQAKVESIGEENKENCSRCGRANTWHPDCPTCKRIDDLEQFIVKLSYIAACADLKDKITKEMIFRNTLEVLNITEDDLINQHNKIYHKLVNSIIGRE